MRTGVGPAKVKSPRKYDKKKWSVLIKLPMYFLTNLPTYLLTYLLLLLLSLLSLFLLVTNYSGPRDVTLCALLVSALKKNREDI